MLFLKGKEIMTQDIGMQIRRLEVIIDQLYINTEISFGNSHELTIQAIKAIMYLQGLKQDWETLCTEEIARKDAQLGD